MGSTEHACECGFRFLNSIDHRGYVAFVMRDQDYDAFWELIDNAIENTGSTSQQKEKACMDLRCSLFRAGDRIWQCPNCGHVYIPDGSGKAHKFAAEPGTPTDLLKGRGISLKNAPTPNS